MKAGKGDGEDEFDDGPVSVSERRVHTPVRAQAVKRKKLVHGEEPDLKKIIADDNSDDDMADGNGMGVDIDAIRARCEDERIVCLAMLGRNLHDVFSNDRIKLAVAGRAWKVLMLRRMPLAPNPTI